MRSIGNFPLGSWKAGNCSEFYIKNAYKRLILGKDSYKNIFCSLGQGESVTPFPTFGAPVQLLHFEQVERSYTLVY